MTTVTAAPPPQFLSPCQPALYWTFYFSPVIVLGGAMLIIGKILHQVGRARARLSVACGLFTTSPPPLP
jgi:hypothetical protein